MHRSPVFQNLQMVHGRRILYVSEGRMIAGYKGSLEEFLDERSDVLGQINTKCANYCVLKTQRKTWEREVAFLRRTFGDWRIEGNVYFECKILGMSKWVDVVLLIRGILFVVEFKMKAKKRGEVRGFNIDDIDQVVDYANDISSFNSACHFCPIVPILIDTGASSEVDDFGIVQDNIYSVMKCVDPCELRLAIEKALGGIPGNEPVLTREAWEESFYNATPTILDIVENAWSENDDEEMLRSGVGEDGVKKAVEKLNEIVARSKANHEKSICFLTGVPGAGKTLVGLKLAGQRLLGEDGDRAYITGNYPLINVLRRKWEKSASRAIKLHKAKAEKDGVLDKTWRDELRKVGYSVQEQTSDGAMKYIISGKINSRSLASQSAAMIKDVKTFKESYSSSGSNPPSQHVVAFDEAQRAWVASDKEDGERSEPEELISYMDRHKRRGENGGWCVFVALVGSGQDIHTGEAGIATWYSALAEKFDDWQVYVPCDDPTPVFARMKAKGAGRLHQVQELHLDTPMRSFRAKMLSEFVEAMLKGRSALAQARAFLTQLNDRDLDTGKTRFRLYVTRNLQTAKEKVRELATGRRRAGILCSSKAKRVRKFGVFAPVKDFDETAWFLNDNQSIESSSALEIAANQFKVQGLELDYTILAWDGDFCFDAVSGAFKCRNYSGLAWKEIGGENKDVNERHLKNAYRVLLTRAREGMVIYVPKVESEAAGSVCAADYDSTYDFLTNKCTGIGIAVI